MISRALVKQLTQFGLVGVTAAAVNYAIVVYIVSHFSWHPLEANVLAFCVAFQVSYFGHRRFTFSGTSTVHKEAYTKLLAWQVCNLGITELFFYALLLSHLPYQIALLIVLATMPIVTFTVSRFWIFK